MDTFPGDYYGYKCRSGKKSSDIFNDYLDLMDGVLAYDEYEINSQLTNDATAEEFESWERHMLQGFSRCATYDHNMNDSTRLALTDRCVDDRLYSWWHKALREKSITSATFTNFRKFLRECFIPYSTMVPSPKPMVTVEVIKQPPKVVHGIEDVGKSIAPILKIVTAVTTPEKLIAVPLPTVSKMAATNSELSAVDVVKADIVKDIVEEVVPLSGLNMQLKRVHDETCMIADRGQRWNLFQAQCIIKGKACKLMIDSGSYYNGINKSVVEALGLSTWRIPEPRHVEWVNSCGMLKITHKVCVPFILDDYVDEMECDVLPLEVCGLLLGRPWQYDRNAMHAGRANTYSFMHDGKQRTLKPMRDDQIKSDVMLVVRKEKLHKAKPQPGLAKVHHEEHDAHSVSGDIVLAKPVDDKPVVLVSDKPVEVKPHIAEGKDMSACVRCVPLPVRVDMGVQTDDGGADRVPVHIVLRVVSHSFVRAPRKCFFGAVLRVMACG
jgi:hypothetical protein